MAYHKHFLLTWGGRLFASEERWQCSLRLSQEYSGLLDDGPYQYCVDNITDAANDVKAFHQTANMIAYDCTLDTVKMMPIGPDGKYATGSDTVEHQFPAGTIHGGHNTKTCPPQITLAVSLVTASHRGRGSKGRFFMPMPAYGLYNTGVVEAEFITIVATAAQKLINDLNNWPGLDEAWVNEAPKVGVFSRLDASYHFVTGVRVGQVLDTQRRRRKSLDEKYSATLPVA